MQNISNINILTLSEFILAYFKNAGEEITQLKLQKLLYYSQSWHLVYFEKSPLFPDEPEAWVNGPVYTAVYRAYARAKNEPIPVEISGTSETYLDNKLTDLNINSDQQSLLYSVLKQYGMMSDIQLVYRTHTEKPWINARKGIPPFARSNEKISHDSMYSYYKQRIEKSN